MMEPKWSEGGKARTKELTDGVFEKIEGKWRKPEFSINQFPISFFLQKKETRLRLPAGRIGGFALAGRHLKRSAADRPPARCP